MAHLSLRLFGQFVAILDGDPIPSFVTEKARALLAYLAVEPPLPHGRPALTALLWDEQPEERARQSLRQALLHLRQALGERSEHSSFFCATRETVQFNPGAGVTVDVLEFQTRIAACRSHRHRRLSSCRPCLQRLRQAAELYRGDFLQHLALPESAAYQEWALLKREWLHQQAVEALAVLADYHEQRQEVDLARDYAHRQVELEPWNEEAHRQLMRLLALEGKRSAALAQYESCRRALMAELGVEPARETAALHARVRSGEAVPPAAAPFRLPPDPTCFVGRERELAALSERLAQPDCRLVTLVGPGGSGKTRLALEAAAEQRGAYRDGIYYVPLAAVGAPEEIPRAVAAALEFSFRGTASPGQQLVDYLQHQEMLLVLDNMEHLLGGSTYLDQILRQAPQIVLLVASRERLDLREEWVYEVEGLPYPATTERTVADSGGALELFSRRAAQADQRFALSADDWPHVARICQLVQGMPLAIELAAAAVRTRSCQAVAAELAGSLNVLATTLRNVPARHRSMHAALEHSWNLLTTGEREILARLSVFRGGFAAQVGQEVGGAAPGMLERLASKSLLRVAGERFGMHELLRQYGAEKLAAAPDLCAQTNDLHCSYYAGWLQRLHEVLHGPDPAPAVRWVQAELENLRAAWQWALEKQRWAEIGRALDGVVYFYRLQGPLGEAQSLLAAALAAADEQDRCASGAAVDPLLRSRLQTERANLFYAQGQFAEAAAAAGEAIRLAAQAGPGAAPGARCRAEGASHLSAGQAQVLLGAYEEARAHLDQALALSRRAAALPLEAETQRVSGALAFRQGQYDSARAAYELALHLFRGLRDRRGESWALNDLAGVHALRGEQAAAGALFAQVAQIGHELGDRHGQAIALTNLGTVLVYTGAYGQARAYLAQAAGLFHEVGDRVHEGTALANLGWLLFDLFGHPSGRHYLERAGELIRETGLQAGEYLQLAFMAQGLYRTGQFASARHFAELGVAALGEGAPPGERGNALTRLGHAMAAQGQLEAAAGLYEQALALWDPLPETQQAMDALAGLAWVRTQLGEKGRALPLIERLLPLLERFAPEDEWPFLAYQYAFEVLRAIGDPRAAATLEAAHTLLQSKASRIDDEELRRSFLENMVVHRQIAAAWRGVTTG